MSRARRKPLKNLDSLLRSDWQNVLLQARLGKEDSYIADQYFLESVPQVEIAAALNVDRSTVSKRLPKILDELEQTAKRLGY